jgi:transposase
MPWKQVSPMDERIKFVARYLADECTMTELCEDFEISRKTGYKWLERYEAGGCARTTGAQPRPAHARQCDSIRHQRTDHRG